MKKLVLFISLLFITTSFAQYESSYTGAEIDAGISPYRVYTALLTQSGTAAPVATVLENTLGGTVVWSRNDVGTYVATLSGAFTANKTFFLTSGATLTDDTNEIIFLSAYWVNSNSIHLYVHDFLGDTIDGKLVGEGSPLLEIRVYP